MGNCCMYVCMPTGTIQIDTQTAQFEVNNPVVFRRTKCCPLAVLSHSLDPFPSSLSLPSLPSSIVSHFLCPSVLSPISTLSRAARSPFPPRELLRSHFPFTRSSPERWSILSACSITPSDRLESMQNGESIPSSLFHSHYN